MNRAKGQSAWLFLLRHSGNQRSCNAAMKEKPQSHDVRTLSGHLRSCTCWLGRESRDLPSQPCLAGLASKKDHTRSWNILGEKDFSTWLVITARCTLHHVLWKGNGCKLIWKVHIYAAINSGVFISLIGYGQLLVSQLQSKEGKIRLEDESIYYAFMYKKQQNGTLVSLPLRSQVTTFYYLRDFFTILATRPSIFLLLEIKVATLESWY